MCRHVNPGRIVDCRFPPSKLEAFHQASQSVGSVDERVEVAKKTLGPELEACAQLVMALENNRTALRQKLAQPFFHNNSASGSVFDFEEVGRHVQEVLRLYRSDLATELRHPPHP